MTLFEMARQQSKTEEQTKQVSEDDPFMLDVSEETRNAIACLKASERDFIDRDRHQTGKGNPQSMLVEDRDAKQRQPEQDEIERDIEQGRIRESNHTVCCSWDR